MRKSRFTRLILRATGITAIVGSVGLLCPGSVAAQEACTVGEGCTSCAPTDCCEECDKIFANSANDLSCQLQRLTAECCAPACGCGVEGCTGCSEGCCDTGCCESDCGWCNLGDPWTLSDECSTINLGGWFQFGYHTENNGLFNRFPNNVNLQQGWIFAEKVADGSDGLDWGFRMDMMYGVDAMSTQAFGNNPGRWDFANGWDRGIYGWALPQLYGELASGDWSIIFGHFYTIIGYEVVTAPDNFFYSHAYTMFNSEPFTHTGALATYSASDNVTIYGGYTLGWDTGFDRFNGGSNFLGGASVGLSDTVTFTYITTLGDFGWRGEGYSHSCVLDTQLSDNLNYVMQSDLVETNAGADHQYGLNQYLLYSVNDCLGVGGRMEWWKNGSASQYAATFGVNIKPHANLIFRPEVRHDWNPAGANIIGKNNYTSFGMDAIITF